SIYICNCRDAGGCYYPDPIFRISACARAPLSKLFIPTGQSPVGCELDYRSPKGSRLRRAAAAARWRGRGFRRETGKEASRACRAQRQDRPAGQVTVERDFSARVRTMGRTERLAMVERGRGYLSVSRRCALLGLARSGADRRRTSPAPQELTLMQ